MKESTRRNGILSLKAFIVGATMTIPGVSGGSMAMILGEYDNLISSIPGLLRKDRFKRSFIYLFLFGVFGLLGIFIASKPMSMLLDKFYDIVMYFFIGAVIGTIPMMVKEAGIERADKGAISLLKVLLYIVYVAIGIGIVFAIEALPEGVFTPSFELNARSLLLQLVGGSLISIGFVLPGISTSYLLVVLGLYNPIMECISTMDFLPLIPIAIGAVLGTFLLTGFLSWAMDKHSRLTYMIILGFLIGSIIVVFPAIPSGLDILYSTIALFLGSAIIYAISRAERKPEM